MKFSFTQSVMLKALQRVMGAVSSRVPMPSLNNLHFRLDGKSLEITATDLEITVTARIDLVESEGSGEALVQARRFQDLIRELPDVSLELEVNEKGQIVLKGEGVGTYSLPGDDPLEFPEMPTVDADLTFSLTGEKFRRIISKTIFAVSADEMRPILTGLLVQIEPEKLTVVATDGHRLSRIIQSGIDYDGDPRDVIVPMKALSVFMKNLEISDMPSLGLAETRASFSSENHGLITRLIDGVYPKYEGVIPRDNSFRLQVRTGDLMSAVRRVAIFSNQISKQINLRIEGATVKLDSEDPDTGGRGEEELAVDYNGEPLEVAYNANYLMDVLKQVDTEETIIAFGMSKDAAIIYPTSQEENEDFMMLLMPIRLR